MLAKKRMRIITARQSKVVGVLGLFGVALAIFIFLRIGPNDKELAVTSIIVAAYMCWLFYFGLFSSWLAFDQAYLVKRRGSEYERLLMEDITSVRTIPFFRSMGILWIRHSSGKSVRTVVLDQDLTWIMSRVPRSAITPYWARKIG